MAISSVLSFSLCLLVFSHCCLARQMAQFRSENECQIQNLDALEPNNRIRSEAGETEVWDQNEEQLRCAGVAIVRHHIEPRGLLLPSFTNAPQLAYIVQGRGIHGTLIPGCPETFQSFQESQQGQGQRFQDQHQKIRHFREGDIIALPAGVAQWVYNDGDQRLVAVVFLDTGNNANQLDLNPRRFYLAGNPEQEHEQQGGRERGQEQQSRERERQRERRERGQESESEREREREQQRRERGRGQENEGNNIFSGFDARLLAEAFGVNEETARRLQSPRDNRGNIVRVEGGLRVVSPPHSREEQERQEREEERRGGRGNGLEETICSLRLRENIGDPSRADVYTPQAGRISSLNSQNLPILRLLQLSAERGVLYRNAILAPHYNLNAHSVTYVTRGRARVQIVDNNGDAVFDDELREGQVLVHPQNFAVMKQAGNEGFEWVSFKTDDNAMISPLAGRTSVIRALPEEVLANSFQISREDARRLKYNREETTVFAPSSRSERRATT